MPSVGTVSSSLATVVKYSAGAANPGEMVLADATAGPFQVTLPSAAVPGTVVVVKKVDTTYNVVTVAGAVPAATIDNDPNATLSSPNVGATFVSDGTAWRISGTTVLNTAAAAPGGTADGFFAPAYTSGYWYDRRSGTSALAATTNTSYTMSGSVTVYVPTYLHRAVSVSAIALGVGSGTPIGAVRIGAYKPDGVNGVPSTLYADYGLLSVAGRAGTIAVLTLASAVTLPKGFSWWALAFSSSTAGPLSGISTAASVPSPAQGYSNTFFTYSNLVTNSAQASAYNANNPNDGTGGALPATAPEPSLVYNTLVSPNVFYRIA